MKHRAENSFRKEQQMVFRHKAGGSSEVIHTMNPIYQYGVDTGNPKPPLHKGEYPSGVATHKHPAPKGERDRYDDRLAPKASESGAHFIGGSDGTAAPGVTAPSGKYSPLKQGLYHKYQDRFNDGFGRIGSGEMEARGHGGPARSSKGVAYKDGAGRTKYRGTSG
jgi:hypothetical protein